MFFSWLLVCALLALLPPSTCAQDGDYTDSYEAADKQGNKSEMIKNESEDFIYITGLLKRKLAAARRRRKKKRKGSDFSFVGKDSNEEKKNSKFLKI